MDSLTQEQRQRLFDAALFGIRAQGGLSYDFGAMSCVYRLETDDGTIRKCAIGHSIPDEHYHPDMEGTGVQAHPVLAALGHPSGLPDKDVHFLMGLQQCHDYLDQYRTPDETLSSFEANMAAFADRNGLVFTEKES